MIKDADYYKQRIKDLPYDLLNEIREMYKEAESHRFICISIQELCAKLRLEYEENSFAKQCQENYLRINSYLEELNLKLIPCSVPADISFTDKIYVTPKPNLNNDPDCSYVKALIAAKKTPTAKDLSHITRMNVKLSNYNVMLRVFEGLFIVSSGKLDPHQRATVNSIMSEMELPKEGLAYLRACYTYACEFRNHHCDYSNQAYCFKPLNDEMQKRVSKYLALIAASSNYREPFNQEYPFLKDIESEYRKLGARAPKQNLSFEDTHDQNSTGKYTTINSLERLFLELKVVSFNYLFTFKGKTQDLSKSFVCKNSKISENRFLSSFYEAIRKEVPDGFLNLIPQKDNLLLTDFSDIENVRAVPKLYVTANKQISLLYPNVFYKNSQDLQSNSFFEEYKAFLQNSTVIKDRQTHNLKTVTSTKTNNCVLFFNYFLRLVLADGFIRKDDKQRVQALNEAYEEYKVTLRSELLLFSALSFIFFDLNSQLKKGTVKTSDALLVAFYTYPQLTHLCLYSVLLSGHKNTIEDYYQIFPEVFELYIFKELFKNTDKKYKWIDELKTHSGYLPKFIVSIVRSAIGGNIRDFISANVHELTEKFEKLENRALDKNIIFDDSIRDINAGTYRDMQPLVTHPVFSHLIAPLLSYESLRHITDYPLDVNREKENCIYEDLSLQTDNLKYLSALSINSNKALANLITDNLTRLESQLIKRSLKDQTFTKYNQLCDFLKIDYSYLATECIENVLPKLGLMIVPIDQSLPKEARSKLTYHRIISTNLPNEAISRDFMHKLCAAQMAFLIFTFIVPVSSADVRLSRYMDLTPEQNVFALKFFATLKNLMKGAKPFDKAYYRKLSAEQKNNGNYKLCLRYLRQLAVDEIAQSPLKNYLEEKFNELFASLSVREHAQENAQTSVSDLEKAKEQYQKIDAQNKNNAVFSSQANSIKSSEHSFFKAASFDVRKLDTTLIASKLNESAQIQDVITKIRIDEGTLDTEETKPVNNVQNQPYGDRETAQSEINAQNPKTAYQIPSDACEQLVLSLKAQGSDVIDMSEFKGICLSLKFMSMDAAIEELNDWCYEIFDEPLLDLSPEENCIYITTEILDKI